MKKYLIVPVLVLIGVIHTGCEENKNKTVIGTGDVVSMVVTPADFTGVNVIGTCDVNIQIGATQSVVYYAQQEVLDVMTYQVVSGILQITFEPGVTVNTSEEIRAEITIPAVTHISVSGAGDFELTGAKQSSLDIYITGAGNVDAYGMKVDACSISIEGAGECKVWVNNTLDVDIAGVGNIYYKGDPVITSNIYGTGSIIDDNN